MTDDQNYDSASGEHYLSVQGDWLVTITATGYHRWRVGDQIGFDEEGVDPADIEAVRRVFAALNPGR